MAESHDGESTPPMTLAMQAAAPRIRRDKRLTDEQAARIVLDECSARGVKTPHNLALGFARTVKHPYWPLVHPIRAKGHGYTWTWGSRDK